MPLKRRMSSSSSNSSSKKRDNRDNRDNIERSPQKSIMSYNAERAQETSRLVQLQRKNESEALADRIVSALDIFIQEQCADGQIKTQWTIPEVDIKQYPEFNMQITRRAVRHYLRNGRFYWQEDMPCLNTYTISWEVGWTPPIIYNKGCVIV